MEPGEARELGFVTVLIPATQAQPGVGREQMRPNKALCVLGAVICASATLLIINNTKSETRN